MTQGTAMRNLFMAVLLMLAFGAVRADDPRGLVTKPSPWSVSETIDRLEELVRAKGITIALRWNHGERAGQVGIPLRPTELLMFGNPKLGSHLFTSRQSAGIDLPMKVLAWEDKEGRVWLGYNDPRWIAARHGIDDRDEMIGRMSRALDGLTDRAVAKP